MNATPAGTETVRKDLADQPTADRSAAALAFYRLVQNVVSTLCIVRGGLRATGRRNIPQRGGVLLISNHVSFLDVFLLGIMLRRPLNYVARSTLFIPVLGFLMRTVGAFPINRDGLGAQGLKETLRRLRNGGIVILFPEGTRSKDGELAELKPGITTLGERAGVPIVPAGLAGTFEAWPRHRLFPKAHPIRVHFGPPILPSETAGLDPQTTLQLLRDRMLDAQRIAREGVARDLRRI